MKNTLFHFGDSFGCWENGHRDGDKHTTKGFSNYVAEYFNLNHEHRAEESLSNAQIISRIITEIPNFKNDISLRFPSISKSSLDIFEAL